MRDGSRSTATRLASAAIASLVLVLAYGLAQTLVPVRVTGGSMAPSFQAGDLALVRRGAKFTTGDVVLFAAGEHGLKVLHRAVRETRNGWVTQGDANPVPDLEALPPARVIGVVVAVVPVGAAAARWRRVFAGATLHNQSQTVRR